MNKIKTLILKVWNNKLGGALIINLTWMIILALFALLKSIIQNIKITEVLQEIWEFLILDVNLPVYFLVILTIGTITIKFIYQKRKNNFSQKIFNSSDKKKNTGIELPVFQYGSSAAYFEIRISNVFPSQRGLKWFNDKTQAKYRLKLFLKKPLVFRYLPNGEISPFWWFRGTSSNSIKSYKRLNRKINQMNFDELSIRRIAVYKSSSYLRNFIYVETEAMKQTGVYDLKQADIERMKKAHGYAWEPYAIIQGNRKIKSSDDDDGSTIIRNKVVPIRKSKIRTRYLTDYNFFIVPNDSPINNNHFSQTHEQYSNDLLNASENDKINLMEKFIKLIEELPNNHH